MIVDALRCNDCGRIGLSVDGCRVTDYECAGSWTVVASAACFPQAKSKRLLAFDLTRLYKRRLPLDGIDLSDWEGFRVVGVERARVLFARLQVAVREVFRGDAL